MPVRLTLAGVYNVHHYRRSICHVAQPTFVGCNGTAVVFEVIFFLSVRRKDANVCVLEEELGVEIAADKAVGLDDFLEFHIDKVVVRIDVLLDETLGLQERRQ